MQVAKIAARGSVILAVGNALAAVGAALAQALVGRLLGPTGFGLFSLAVVSASIFQLFVGLGAGIAVTRYVANYVSTGQPEKAREFTRNAMAFTALTGTLLTLFVYAMAGPIASAVFHRPELAPYIRITSVAIAAQGYFLAVIAGAVGWDAMGTASMALVAQSFARAFIAPALILAGWGVAGAAAGHSLAYVLAAAVFGALLFARKGGSPAALSGFGRDVRDMISYGFPAYAAYALNGLATYYVSVILSIIATGAVVGYYQAAWNFSVPVTLLSTAAATAVFPAFAKLKVAEGDLRSAFRLSVKLLSYGAIPLIVFVVASAHQLMFVLYGKHFAPGVGYVALLALTNLPILFGFNIFPAFLNGVDRTRATLAAIASEAAAVVVLAPFLGGYLGLGVYGLVWAVFLSNAASTVTGMALMRAPVRTLLDLRAGALISAAALAGFAGAYLVPDAPGNLIPLVGKFVVFAAVYLAVAPALGAVTPAELDMMGEPLSSIPVLGPVAGFLVRYQKEAYLRARRKGDGPRPTT